MSHGSYRLNGLTKAHLIAEEDLALMQYILCAEFLIHTQVPSKGLLRKLHAAYFFGQLPGYAVVNKRPVTTATTKLLQQGIEIRAV